MKRVILFAFLLCLGAMIAGFAAYSDSDEEMLTAAKALDKKFIEAYNNGDLDALMAVYWNSPNLVSYPPDMMKIHGWQAAKTALEEAFANMPGGTLELLESNNKVLGDHVLGWGTWRMTIEQPEEEPIVMEGRYTDVKAKIDGKWVYVLDHASVPMSPPEE